MMKRPSNETEKFYFRSKSAGRRRVETRLYLAALSASKCFIPKIMCTSLLKYWYGHDVRMQTYILGLCYGCVCIMYVSACPFRQLYVADLSLHPCRNVRISGKHTNNKCRSEILNLLIMPPIIMVHSLNRSNPVLVNWCIHPEHICVWNKAVFHLVLIIPLSNCSVMCRLWSLFEGTVLQNIIIVLVFLLLWVSSFFSRLYTSFRKTSTQTYCPMETFFILSLSSSFSLPSFVWDSVSLHRAVTPFIWVQTYFKSSLSNLLLQQR